VFTICVFGCRVRLLFFFLSAAVRRHATREEAEGAARAKVVRGPTGPSFHSPLDYPRGSLRGRIRRFINHSLYLIEPRQSRALRLIPLGRFYLNAGGRCCRRRSPDGRICAADLSCSVRKTSRLSDLREVIFARRALGTLLTAPGGFSCWFLSRISLCAPPVKYFREQLKKLIASNCRLIYNSREK
jgi:hypothetical protein